MKCIENRNRRKFEPERYLYVVLKEHGTGRKIPCMFTHTEIADMEVVSASWLRLRNNVLCSAVIAKKPTHLWYSAEYGKIFRIGCYQLERATERAFRNQEDLPAEKSFWTRLCFWKR